MADKSMRHLPDPFYKPVPKAFEPCKCAETQGCIEEGVYRVSGVVGWDYAVGEAIATTFGYTCSNHVGWIIPFGATVTVEDTRERKTPAQLRED